MWQEGCRLTGSKVGDWHPWVSNVSHIWTRAGPDMAACKQGSHMECITKSTLSMPCPAGNAAPAATEVDAANGRGTDKESSSPPVKMVEQRILGKAKKVALFLAYNGKGYLVRRCCCHM